jgi:hypothetical protein
LLVTAWGTCSRRRFDVDRNEVLRLAHGLHARIDNGHAECDPRTVKRQHRISAGCRATCGGGGFLTAIKHDAWIQRVA